MSHPRTLAAITRRAMCLALVMFCVGAWLAPVATAQTIGDVIDDVVGGGGGGAPTGGTPDTGGDTGTTDGGGGLVGGVIDELEGENDGQSGTGSDPVGAIVDAVDKKASDPSKTVDDTTKTVDDTTGGTVGDIQETVGSVPAVDGTVKKVKELTGKTGNDKKTSSRPATRTTSYPVMDTWEVLGDSFANATAPAGSGRGASGALTSAQAISTVSSFDDSVISQIGRVAAQAVEQAAFPIALTLMVVAFLMVQNRIDRKDPKLALAPVDSEHDLLSFT